MYSPMPHFIGLDANSQAHPGSRFPLLPFTARRLARYALRGAFAGILAATLGVSDSARAQTVWPGPNFQDLAGVNNSGPSNPLLTNALSYNRHPIYWSDLQPNSTTWDLTNLTAAGTEVQSLAAAGARLLPILCYCPNWAADLTSRQWTYGNNKWTIAPGSGGTMVENEYDIPSGNLLKTTTYVVGSPTQPNFSKFPPASTSNWTAYVQKVVNYLHASPYNVQYFQVWNEAQEYSIFWIGSMSDYFTRVHLPAAQIIHAAGAKVVYGGFPDCGSVSELISLLDANSAWGSIDVIDTHYFGTVDAYVTLRAAADSRGYPNLAIWQTEIGYTSDFSYLPAAYTRRLGFALTNNWTQDKYKAFYFANSSTNSSSDPAYNHCLYNDSTLTPHGQCLQALANLLGGSSHVSIFGGISSSPSYSFDLSAASSMETFAVGDTLLTAMNLGATDYNANLPITYTLPLARSCISKAERVDVLGNRTDLTSTLVANGATTNLPNVAIKDTPGSNTRAWNDNSGDKRTFYTAITLAQPYEGENLAIAAQTSGVTNTTSSDPNFSNGAGVYFNATAAGQYVTYTVPSVFAGTYDVRVGVKNWNNKGTWQLAISRLDQLGSAYNQGSPVDEYTANTAYGEVDLGNWSPGTTSDKAFKFTVTGKNASSSGYGIDIDYIKLIGIYEAENLAIAAQTSGITETVTSDVNFSNGAATYFNATAWNQGQYVTYVVPGINAGVYDVHVGYKAYNNKGMWQLAISRADLLGSTANLGVPVDQYNAGTVYTDVDLGTWAPGTTGDKAFKFTVMGQNPASSGCGIDIDYIKIIPL